MSTYYRQIMPLGKLTVATAGTPVLLSTNCGPLAGNGVTQVAGRALRGIQLTAPTSNTDILYLLPSGKTYASNPEAIMAALLPGTTLNFPFGVLLASGILPESFVLDTPTSGQTCFGCGFFG